MTDTYDNPKQTGDDARAQVNLARVGSLTGMGVPVSMEYLYTLRNELFKFTDNVEAAIRMREVKSQQDLDNALDLLK